MSKHAYMTDAELIAAVSINAAGRYRYGVVVDEGPMGGLMYEINANNAAQAKHVAAEHAARIKHQRVWRVYTYERTKR